MFKRFSKSLILTLLLLFTLSFIIKTDNSFDVDLGRHIKLGEIIWTSHQIPKVNLFSYAYPNSPFINLQYLFAILVYLANSIFNLQGLLLLKIIIILLSLYLIIILAFEKNRFLLLPISFVFLHLLRGRTELRPEIFSFLFTSITYFVLERFEKKSNKWVCFLVLIQLIWINIHIYFVIGFILQTIFLIHFYLSKEFKKFKILLFVICFSVLISTLNPYLISGLLYPLFVFNNYGVTVSENQNIFFLEFNHITDPNFLFLKISAAIIILSFIRGFIKHNINFKTFMLPLVGLILALANLRSFPYIIFLSLIGTLQNYKDYKNTFVKLLNYIIIPLMFFEAFFYTTNFYYKYSDSNRRFSLEFKENFKNGLDFFTSHNLPSPIFNNFDIGAYIIYRGYPNNKVFIDSRTEAYPTDFYKYEYATGFGVTGDFKAIDNIYNFQTIIFAYSDLNPWEKDFTNAILKDPNWKLVYLDGYSTILTRNEFANSNSLTEIKLQDLNPDNYHFDNHNSYLRLASFLLNAGYEKKAILFVKKALAIFPNSPYANYLMAKINSNSTSDNLLLETEYINKSQFHIWW